LLLFRSNSPEFWQILPFLQNTGITLLNSSKSAAVDTFILLIMQVIPDFTSSNDSELLVAKNMGRAVNEQDTISRSAADKIWPANSPIIVFFDDIIYRASIEGNFEIFVGKKQVYGTISISSSRTKNDKLWAILTFMPYKPFDFNKNVTIRIKRGLKDKCGNRMIEDKIISFTATRPREEKGFAPDNWGFEESMEGIEITGDGKIFEGNGTLEPHSGEKLAAISSGDYYYNNGKSILFTVPMGQFHNR